MNPISVIIVSNDSGKNLDGAVQSVVQQTPPAEIIVVNAGATDDATRRLLDAYAQKGIVVFDIPDRGAWAARNYGISAAKSPYILCLDCDEVLAPAFLEKTAQRLDAMPQVGVVATYLEYAGAHHDLCIPRDYAPAQMLWKNCLPSSSLFRKRCWEEAGGFKDLPAGDDWEFWITVTVELGWQWLVVPEVLCRKQRCAHSEHLESNQEDVLRHLISRHETAYQAHLAEILIALNKNYRAALDKARNNAEKLRDSTRMLEDIRKVLNGSLLQSQAANHDGARSMHSGSPSHPIEPARSPDISGRPQMGQPVQRRSGEEDSIQQRIHDALQMTLPRGASILAVSDGREGDFDGSGRYRWQFLAKNSGLHPGHDSIDGNIAIAMVEDFRAQDVEFLLFDPPGLTWLENRPELSRYLSHRYRVVGRHENAWLLFDLRQPMEQHTFSVVICTYKRPDFLEKAIASVFALNYPKDKYEIIIVNNDSPDNTEEVIRQNAGRSPVAFSSYVEKRNGISFCRNLGVEKAKHEFVAFLDDDETASPDWLAIFNAIINEHHALVVCGRVDRALEPNFVLPPWFEGQYLKGFFTLDYCAHGRQEKVFRIRYPNHFGTGNSAYAKRLFAHFGNFDVKLGRDGKTLRSGEDTYFNWVLDRNDIPTYYSHDAYISHFIEPERFTKRYLRRKCYWNGLTNALINTQLFGCEATLDKTKNAWKALWKQARLILRHPRDPEMFGHFCNLLYQLGFISQFYRIYLRQKLSRQSVVPPQATWTSEHWLAEVLRWPEGTDKYRELYQYYLFREDKANADSVFSELATYLGLTDPAQVARALQAQTIMDQSQHYASNKQQIQQLVNTKLPREARVLVVSKGDEELIQFEGRHGWHFPQTGKNVYAGSYPAKSTDAIVHLEELRREGAEFLLLPRVAFWWLDHYHEFAAHLQKRYQRILPENEACLIFDLRTRVAGQPNGTTTGSGRQPTVLAPASHRSNYAALKQQISQIVAANLPDEARVLVVSKGDQELLQFEGRSGWHFPQTGNNVYAGHYPASSAEAISHLEELRADGADFLLLPRPAFWWLDHYTDFKAHLESRYGVVTQPSNDCVIFDLRNRVG